MTDEPADYPAMMDWFSGEGRRIANEHVDAGMRALNEKQARRWAEEESDV